ncbi:hypothetical protein PPO43_11385 [Saprospira sp. CCB-QB6]|uniref:hypothetical protein n=1 Tax=Saprospira sp. CCB-QB6 TaxID=3023936 RepID=UPI00234ADE1C|nr:hypothetical protein [Saprospira sp. CCB-QB6]WCL80570.1 hypothetical protein PPO43_11385 [Saprospira sp. CCB-QB6]
MKKTILLFLILGLFACETKEQENKAVQDVTSSAQSASLPQRDSLVQFPKDWEGRYEGEMHWYVNGQLRGVIPCRHEVLPQKSGVWSWKTTYDSTQILPQTVVKDYLLLEDKSQPQGHFILDEQDGILLDMILMGNSFYSQFEVNGSRINTIDRLEGGLLYKEIVITTKDKVRKSSAQTGKKTFEVESANSIIVQKAILKKQE